MIRLGVLLVAVVGLGFGQFLAAAEPIRLTTDGRVKRDPVFSKPDGSELLFAVLDRPKQLRLMKLTLASGKVESLHPDETRSEFEPAVSRDGRFLAFVQNRGNLSLAMVIKDLMNGHQVDVPPGGGFSGMHSPAMRRTTCECFTVIPKTDGSICSRLASTRRIPLDSWIPPA